MSPPIARHRRPVSIIELATALDLERTIVHRIVRTLEAEELVETTPNGYRLATGSTDQTIRLWDATTGAAIMCVTRRAAGIYDLAYSPDGRTLASGHGDGAIRIWKA